MNTIPGISVWTKDLARGQQANNPTSAVRDITNFCSQRFVHTVCLGDWISATIDTRNNKYDAFYSDETGITVLLDGYLSAPHRDNDLPQAEWVARRYLEQDVSFLNELRGSYTCLIYDARSDTAIVFNDRLGSRPLYYYKSPQDSYALGPEILRFSEIEHATEDLDFTAVIEFLIAGNHYTDRTLFQNIRKVPQASVITLTKNSFNITSYWQLRYPIETRAIDENAAIDECHSLLLQAVDRTVRCCKNPVLFLSGGMDSRLVLGLLLEKGFKIPVACYGSGEGDDFDVAKRIASDHDLRLTEFHISFDDVVSHLAKAVAVVDGRSEVLDAPSLYLFSQSLAVTYDSHIVGDVTLLHKFGNPSALDEVELYALDKVARLGSLIRPEHRRGLSTAIANTRKHLVDSCGTSEFTNLFECLYYTSRLANMQNGFMAGKLRHLEQARPLLDEDVVDFLTRLPVRLRDNKYLYRQLLNIKFPRLAQITYAKKDSLPTPEKINEQLLSNKPFANYVQTTLVGNLDSRLSNLFDTDHLNEFISSYLAGKPLPPMNSSWLMKLPGFWRLLPKSENRVHPVKLIMRLLHIQLYLSEVQRGGVHVSVKT